MDKIVTLFSEMLQVYPYIVNLLNPGIPSCAEYNKETYNKCKNAYLQGMDKNITSI